MFLIIKFGYDFSAVHVSSNTDMTILLLDSFKSNHVGVTKYVRPKNGSYTPATHDYD